MADTPNLDIDKYFKRLMEVASKNGIVSKDEFRLIQNIILNMQGYNQMLKRALQDDIITKDEKAELFKFRTDIFGSNLKIINEDQEITEEEEDILVILQRMLDEMRNLEELAEMGE